VQPVPGGSVPVVDATVAASWVAVVGTLGGVAVGAGLDWARSARAERRAAAGRRDELYISWLEAATQLQVEVAGLRALLAAAEREMQKVPPDTARVKAMTGKVTARIREIAPLMREFTLRAARLAMAGDEAVRQAAERLAATAAELLGDLAADIPVEASRTAGLLEAFDGLQRARDAAVAPWWKRRRLRRELAAAPTAARRRMPASRR
jgi:hypothetical protein